MTRYPRSVRDAKFKCIACNAPIVQTIDRTYVCVECGQIRISPNGSTEQY